MENEKEQGLNKIIKLWADFRKGPFQVWDHVLHWKKGELSHFFFSTARKYNSFWVFCSKFWLSLHFKILHWGWEMLPFLSIFFSLLLITFYHSFTGSIEAFPNLEHRGQHQERGVLIGNVFSLESLDSSVYLAWQTFGLQRHHAAFRAYPNRERGIFW